MIVLLHCGDLVIRQIIYQLNLLIGCNNFYLRTIYTVLLLLLIVDRIGLYNTISLYDCPSFVRGERG